MTLNWPANPFPRKPWVINLEDTISDDEYHAYRAGARISGGELPKPGALRWENAIRGAGPYANVQCSGQCMFRWGINRSGAAITRGYVGRKRANQAVANIDSGAVGSVTKAATWTANQEVFGLVQINDDAGAAGAAPEGEWAEIVRNTANILYVQPNFTVAPAANDDLVIYYPSQATLGAAGIEREETMGVVVAASLADDYWGWWGCRGIMTVRITTAALAQGIGMIAAANGELAASSTSGQDLMLARALVAAAADLASQLIPAFVDVIWGTPFTTA